MELKPINRMERDIHNRSMLHKVLKDDRIIMAKIMMKCCGNVLEKQYGWQQDEISRFQEHMEAEIRDY